MSDLELTKKEIITKLNQLCAHCANGKIHSCSVQRIALQVKSFRGVPLIVNNEFRGVIYSHA